MRWLKAYTGVSVASSRVCARHSPPAVWFGDLWRDRPPMAVVLGPRGGGKSFLSALLTHMESRFHANMGTRVLGGSKAQSSQIFEAIETGVLDARGPGGSDADAVLDLQAERVLYRNGSRVSILAASKRSVRGPHVPTLRIDEVDEIPEDLRDAAMGMCMSKNGMSACVTMTSTWHNVGGPMGALVEAGRAGAFPLYESCVFEVLERCPESRSGPKVGGDAGYLFCPSCALKPWCHAERDTNGGVPLAKLADGHYAIDSLVQKAGAVSLRTFEADYLCRGPRADGVWFTGFSPARHVSETAEYDPRLPVHLAIDSGVFTGAVAFQVRPPTTPGALPVVTVFLDYLAENVPASTAASEVLAVLDGRNGTRRKDWTDPAGGARNPIGPTVFAEYERGGLRPTPWPGGSVADGLALLEALIQPAAGAPSLCVHPRCSNLVRSLEAYRRAKRAGQLQDYPEDPQHPWEDLVDALRGGLRAALPDALRPALEMPRVHPNTVRF